MIESFLATQGGDRLYLKNGVYTNMPNVQTHPDEVQPRWLPNHPEPLWHITSGQEVRIVGIQETAGVIQYQIKVINSSDTNIKIAVESQLQELKEAERVPESGNLPINKIHWAPLKAKLLEFLASYPIDAEKRANIESQIKSKNKGYAQAIIDDRQSESGFFAGEADFTDRMNRRCPGFPWDAIASVFDYSLPAR
jgi:hypothetical protein